MSNALNNNTGVQQHLDNRRGVRATKGNRLKDEIAQQLLSDPLKIPHFLLAILYSLISILFPGGVGWLILTRVYN